MRRLSVCIYSLFVIQSNLISIIYHLFTISSNLHVIPYYFFIQKFYRNFYLRSHKIERNSHRTIKTNQTLLFTQEPNKKKKKEKISTKKKKKKKEEGSPGTSSGIWRSVAGVLRRKKTPVEFRRGRGWQGWHVPPRQNGRAKPV